jgi:hypothetical protein
MDYGVKIKGINNDKLAIYANDLMEGIIMSIDNSKATDIETVSKILSNKSNIESTQIEMITKNGQIIRFIL